MLKLKSFVQNVVVCPLKKMNLTHTLSDTIETEELLLVSGNESINVN